MHIAIFGLGYVGLTAAACLTKQGHSVLGVDVSEGKVAQIARGESPITEPGVEDLLRAALADGHLTCVTDARGRLDDCDLAMVCVGTPSGPDGAHNMTYIAEVTRQIATATTAERRGPLTVIYRSTIRPGTMEQLIRPIFAVTLGSRIDQIELVYNPEFLRESVAIQDYFAPSKIVIGTADGLPSARLTDLYAGIEAPTFVTRFPEAEFTKFVDNTFHALKVAFGNEIGRVAVKLGLDTKVVHETFVADTKLNISARYLRPGGAFGGSCLPKDVRALQYIAGDVGAATHVIDALIRSNEAHKHFLFEHCTRGLPPGASILMLGLAFKAHSDDLRESPNVDLARKFLQGGFRLSVFDPSLEPTKLIGQNLGYAFSQLPSLTALLVSKTQAETQSYDAVIDVNGTASDIHLADRSTLIDISRLATRA